MATQKQTKIRKKAASSDAYRVVSLQDLGLDESQKKKVDPVNFSIWIRSLLQNWRQGTVGCKDRSEVNRTNKKPWKQKGTGNARAGSTRSPIWRHGGITFGPRANRNYELKMNKKQWRKALYMTLTDKAQNNGFVVFSELNMTAPKTKEMLALLKNVKDKVSETATKFLFVLPKNDENISKSTRNLKNTKVISANSLNVIDIVNADTILIPQGSLEVIEKTYLK